MIAQAVAAAMAAQQNMPPPPGRPPAPASSSTSPLSTTAAGTNTPSNSDLAAVLEERSRSEKERADLEKALQRFLNKSKKFGANNRAFYAQEIRKFQADHNANAVARALSSLASEAPGVSLPKTKKILNELHALLKSYKLTAETWMEVINVVDKLEAPRRLLSQARDRILSGFSEQFDRDTEWTEDFSKTLIAWAKDELKREQDLLNIDKMVSNRKRKADYDQPDKKKGQHGRGGGRSKGGRNKRGRGNNNNRQDDDPADDAILGHGE